MPKETIRRIIGTKKVFSARLLKWAHSNSPDYPWRNTSNPYRVMISEMLLRRTRAGNVSDVYKTFIRKYPTVVALAQSSAANVQKVIASLGMRNRSRRMVEVARTIAREYRGRFPETENELLEIIGPESHYTVNAIRCFAFNQRVPIFDVNVMRIFGRVFSLEFGKESHKKKSSWDIASLALPERKVKQYNWALLDLGKSICTARNPRCEVCPLQTICDYGRNVLQKPEP